GRPGEVGSVFVGISKGMSSPPAILVLKVALLPRPVCRVRVPPRLLKLMKPVDWTTMLVVAAIEARAPVESVLPPRSGSAKRICPSAIRLASWVPDKAAPGMMVMLVAGRVRSSSDSNRSGAGFQRERGGRAALAGRLDE